MVWSNKKKSFLHLPSLQALIYLLGNKHKHMKEVFNNNFLLKNNLKKLVNCYIHLIFVRQGESTFPTTSAPIIYIFFFNFSTHFKSILEKRSDIFSNYFQFYIDLIKLLCQSDPPLLFILFLRQPCGNGIFSIVCLL